MGEVDTWLAAENLAHQDREDAAMQEHGPVQNLARQAVAQFAAGDGAIGADGFADTDRGK